MNTTNEKSKNSLTIAEPTIGEFKNIIKDIANHPTVLDLKNHQQHANRSRYYHCLSVSFYTYAICKKMHLDYVSAARGAMLHDLYFYDWHVDTVKLHAFRHPRIALNNATEIFELNSREKDVIVKHMWPLTIFFPSYKESYIVTIVDKYCASKELLHCLFTKLRKNKIKV